MEPVKQFLSKIVGVQFTADGRNYLLKEDRGNEIKLIPDNENKYDNFAVAVFSHPAEIKLGYVPREQAPDIRKYLERYVVKTIIEGLVNADKKSIQANLLISLYESNENNN